MSIPRLRVSVFAGAANLPIFAAQERGFFQRQGLSVEVVNTPNSREQMQGLITGEHQIVHTAPDNIFAWEERTQAGLIAFMGGFSGRLSLYAQPEIASVAQLRGRTIGVDAPDTGFVYALRAILEAAGLGPADYSLEPVGGTPFRFAALREGRALATLLNPPFDALADRMGLNKLADHTQVFRSYATGVGGVRRDWAQQHSELVVAYLRAYVAGLVWLSDPRNAEAASAMLAQRLSLLPEVSRLVFETFMDPRVGFLPAAAFDFAGMQTVLELRARWAGWPAVPPLERYYDLTWYQRAFWAGD